MYQHLFSIYYMLGIITGTEVIKKNSWSFLNSSQSIEGKRLVLEYVVTPYDKQQHVN